MTAALPLRLKSVNAGHCVHSTLHAAKVPGARINAFT